MSSEKIAVVLFNLGGPDKLSSVEPFLFNLFNDKAIISLPQPFRFLLAKLISWRRKKTAQEIYKHIGGKSPLLDITRAQADALEKELSFFGDFKVFIAMRYWHPFSEEAVEKIADFAPNQIILLPLYGQFSTSTTESSIDDFMKKLANSRLNTNKTGFFKKKIIDENCDKLKIKKVCCYFEDEDFVLSHAKLIKQKIIDLSLDLDEFRVLFSAHGLPQKLIDQGDPYVYQIEKTTKAVVAKLNELLNREFDYKVCFQSKVGPLEWTKPSLENEIRRASLDKKNPLIVPIAFVSEHSETLVELDIEYKELADEIGIEKYVRVAALNVDGHFIESLAKTCKGVAKSSEVGFFVGDKAKRACPKNFKSCVNDREFL